MNQEPKTIEHTAQPINKLLGIRNQPTVKACKLCEICQDRYADGLAGRLCCVCEREMAFDLLPPDQQKLLLLSVIPERYITAEIEHLKPGLQKAFAQKIENGIMLWGLVGSGKTYAMSALAKKYMSEGFTVQRVHYEVFCLKLRDTFKPQAVSTEWDTIEPLLNCDRLFIEDVGVTKSLGREESDFSRKTFLVLLDIRMEHLRPTFITTNKSLENLGSSFDERIKDRLRTFNIYQMKDKSRRTGNGL